MRPYKSNMVALCLRLVSAWMFSETVIVVLSASWFTRLAKRCYFDAPPCPTKLVRQRNICSLRLNIPFWHIPLSSTNQTGHSKYWKVQSTSRFSTIIELSGFLTLNLIGWSPKKQNDASQWNSWLQWANVTLLSELYGARK